MKRGVFMYTEVKRTFQFTMQNFLDTLCNIPTFPKPAMRRLLAEAKKQGIKVFIISVSGGPLAGKTSGLIKWYFEMMQRGVLVFLVPEAATIVRNGGFKAEMGIISNYDSQRMMLRINEHMLYEFLINALRSDKKTILLIRDRSSIDCAAYMESDEQFQSLLAESQFNLSDLTLNDAHIFLQSLAVDNPKLYDQLCGNNTARCENAKEAAEANNRTIAAYRRLNIPLTIINNEFANGFEGKLLAALNVMLEVVEQPRVQSQRAFIVRAPAAELKKMLPNPVTIEITQHYLNGVQYRKTRFSESHEVFTRAIKTDTGRAGIRYIDTEYMTAQAYYCISRTNYTIKKTRYAGLEEFVPHRLIKFDWIDKPGWRDKMCRVEIDEVDSDFNPPGFLRSYQHAEVTNQPLYSNQSMAEGMTPSPFNP